MPAHFGKLADDLALAIIRRGIVHDDYSKVSLGA
jgi:hypothetical protein